MTTIRLTFLVAALIVRAGALQAHCDSVDGPVVASARQALESGDVAHVLPWVNRAAEREVRSAFARVMKARALGGDSRALADDYFFETVVRIHRAAEGAPYTGLKPSGYDPGEAVRAADKALSDGSVEGLENALGAALAHGVRERFDAVRRHRGVHGRDVEAGRSFVRAYVDFVHFVEGVHKAVGPRTITSNSKDEHVH